MQHSLALLHESLEERFLVLLLLDLADRVVEVDQRVRVELVPKVDAALPQEPLHVLLHGKCE